MTKIKPFLKWAGSKYGCIDTILASFPKARRLIEPFTGSGAVFLNADYNQYLLAEQNPDLVHLFQLLQQEGNSFIDYCETLFTAQNNNSAHYYRLRDEFNQSAMSRRRAALFLYLNRHGYNGLCRYNQSNVFNVPFGRYNKPCFPRAEMRTFHAKSQKASFIHHDFRTTFALAKPGDVIYCDPPYVPLSPSASFASYTGKRFGEQDQIDLANLACASADKGITVIVSNHDTEFTRHHYRQGLIHSFPVRRNISCRAINRKPVQELVAIFGGNTGSHVCNGL